MIKINTKILFAISLLLLVSPTYASAFTLSVTPANGTSLADGVISGASEGGARLYISTTFFNADFSGAHVCGYVEGSSYSGTVDDLYGTGVTPPSECTDIINAGEGVFHLLILNAAQTQTSNDTTFTLELPGGGDETASTSTSTPTVEESLQYFVFAFTLFCGLFLAIMVWAIMINYYKMSI